MQHLQSLGHVSKPTYLSHIHMISTFPIGSRMKKWCFWPLRVPNTSGGYGVARARNKGDMLGTWGAWGLSTFKPNETTVNSWAVQKHRRKQVATVQGTKDGQNRVPVGFFQSLSCLYKRHGTMFIQVRSLKRCGFQWSASQQRLSMFWSRTKYTFLLNQMKLIEFDEINSTIVWVDRIKAYSAYRWSKV